ncbi:MAG: glycosyltransferase family 1 protein [Dehalococcoidia bacterium]|jgi:glycosyltransferase involved in cell wall biosynthesis
MRIGMHVAGLLPYRTGRETYAQALLGALAGLDHDNEYLVFVSPQNRHLFDRPERNFHTVEVKLPRFPSRRLWEIARLHLAPAVRRLDLVHLLESPLPVYQPAKALATIHDIIPLLRPDLFPLKGRVFYRQALVRGTRRLRTVIASSEQTKRDLVARLRLDPQRIRVIYPSVEPRFAPLSDEWTLSAVRQKYALPERFLLYVGTLEPRKNLLRLIGACRGLRKSGFDMPLVLAGGRGWLCDDVIATAEAMPDCVRLTGFVDDADLPALYNAATTFVYPSLYEGFGTPPLEAMACGLPVVCSSRSSLPEVVGDAALLVDPEDEEGIGSAILDATRDDKLRRRLREAGLARARLFSWDDTARHMLGAYEALARGLPIPEKERAEDAA